MLVWLVRSFIWFVVHVFYRLRSNGVKQFIPASGPCVVVCNHVSFVDALVVAAAVKRPIRFIMYHRIFNKPVLGWIFRVVRCIPIAPRHESVTIMERAFLEVRQALARGEAIGLFPEGKITNTGEINEFRAGIERIISETPVPVVPMALRGLWGSFFSRIEGHAMTKPFRRGFWSPIELVAGPPIPASEVTAKTLEAYVKQLRGPVC